MIVKVKATTMIKSAQETPKEAVWISNVDLMEPDMHTRTIYFYMADGSYSNFFDSPTLKEALRKVLVPFYPLAGRFRKDPNGRIEIDCNGEGVTFVEAETDSSLEDLGDFTPTLEYEQLFPAIDRSGGISTFPILVLQVTYFKCGGVSLGLGIHHYVADGLSALHFINSWSDMTRGIDLTVQPFFDHTLLKARDPPIPTFDHIEFQPPFSMKAHDLETTKSQSSPEATISTFKLTKAQLNTLKTKSNENDSTINYSSFETLAAHIWRCTCVARELREDQDTKLFIAVDGRSRIKPVIPQGYFGNVVFTTTPYALFGDLQSNPFSYATSRVHEALERMDSDYLRSAIDYVELYPNHLDNLCDIRSIMPPNFRMISWARLPIYEADFGWGRPTWCGLGVVPCDGVAFVMPSPKDDGSLFIAISLKSNQMEVFEKMFYDI